MESQKAIRYVRHVLGEGNYGYVLRKYVDRSYWDYLFPEEGKGIVVEEITDFNYSRCFGFMFMEDIGIKGSFFKGDSTDLVREKGQLEFISLKISGISPFYTIKKAQYEPIGDRLDITYLEVFKNQLLEDKYQSLMVELEAKKIWQVTFEDLNIRLDNVPLEEYSAEQVTYYSLLFE